MKTKSGSVNVFIIVIIGMSVVLATLGGLLIWTYISYSDQKNNTDSKVEAAVAEARKEQSEADEKKFAEREKEPNTQFVGPIDYGQLSFYYPKTWSLYIAKSASSGGNYEAYFNPVNVPTVNNNQVYALRLQILERDYDSVVKTYESAIKKGALRSSVVSVNGVNGTRLDGILYGEISGSQIIFKIRDKTAIVRTDSENFMGDFNTLISTIKFNT